jgi:hypothetical protein
MMKSGALALVKYAPHCKTMRNGALLKSSNAREGTVVKIWQGMNSSDVGKILCNLPWKKQLQQILAKIKNNPYYYRRHPSRCKERAKDHKEVQRLVLDTR